MHMFSDMVTDRENVRLRGQELCKYFQKVVSDEGAMTHPVTARYLTFDGEMVSTVDEIVLILIRWLAFPTQIKCSNVK